MSSIYIMTDQGTCASIPRSKNLYLKHNIIFILKYLVYISNKMIFQSKNGCYVLKQHDMIKRASHGTYLVPVQLGNI